MYATAKIKGDLAMNRECLNSLKIMGAIFLKKPIGLDVFLNILCLNTSGLSKIPSHSTLNSDSK